MATGTKPRERIAPSTEQVARLSELLIAVPSVGLDWASPEGQQFVAYAHELTGQGTPAKWLADRLDLDPNRLYALLNRHRRTTTSTPEQREIA